MIIIASSDSLFVVMEQVRRVCQLWLHAHSFLDSGGDHHGGL